MKAATSPSASPPYSRLAVAAAVLAAAVAVLALLSSFGTRWGWWDFRTGFEILRWAAYGGIAVAALSLVALYRTRPAAGRRGLAAALIALVLSVATFGVPWWVQRMGRDLPPIHDITTAPENPPQFDAVVPLRADAPNPTEYGGPEVAAQQREAYPEIEPLHLDIPPDRAFPHALDAAREMGWEIVAADSASGRIEATATTFWFGFEDDVVIRLTPDDGGTRVDVRSVSRVGRGDLGVNARRVQEYLEDVRERV